MNHGHEHWDPDGPFEDYFREQDRQFLSWLRLAPSAELLRELRRTETWRAIAIERQLLRRGIEDYT